VGPQRRETDGEPIMTIALCEERMREERQDLHMIREDVTDLRLNQEYAKGAMRVIKVLLAGLFGLVGTDVVGHFLGWFNHVADVVAK
jgi:hypothetical protein